MEGRRERDSCVGRHSSGLYAVLLIKATVSRERLKFKRPAILRNLVNER